MARIETEEKTMVDRFSSREDLEWHPEAESQGREARMMGRPLSANPHPDGWMEKSWRAGWADVDQDPDAPKRAVATCDA